MKDRGTWTGWILTILLAGNLCIQYAECQSRGDEGSDPQSLGFDDVLRRHDGYVKGETPTIPQTSFSCSAQPYNPGLYADVEANCQVYHVCFEDRQESFLCGPGTNFNQRILACDFWYNFECQDSPSFYGVNSEIGKVPNAIFTPGQSRQPPLPRQPEQPPSVGSYPPRVSIPPPAPQPQTPNINIPPPPPRVEVTPRLPEQPRIPQQPRYPQQPQQPRIPQQPQQPRFPQQPQQPRIPQQPPQPRIPQQPQQPRIPQQPQQPRIPQQPQQPRIPQQPQQPEFPQQPQQPVFPQQSQQPRIPQQPQPPRIPPPQPPRVQPPPFQPQPETSLKPDYPRPQVTGHGSGGRQPYPPSIQQEVDSGYQFDGYKPQKPISVPPPPPRPRQPQTTRPAFPPVVSPPRVSRPPLTPPVIRQPEPSISRPRVPVTVTQPEYHPDANLKGNGGYQPPPQQPRLPQPSRPVGSGYPSYPVPQRPVAPRPVPQQPVSRPPYVPPQVQQEHVDTEYVPPPPPPPPQKPSRPAFVPPPPSRPAYNPPPVPKPPKQPSRPSTSFVPPPRPVQQEVTVVQPPPRPSRPAYEPPQVPQRPIEPDYDRPQPPVAPSIINEQQKPVARPPSRPQVTGGARQPERPKPVFPPVADHPNSNIKGGPGYNQPPPQVPRFEPTRIGRPSQPIQAVKPVAAKRPPVSTSGGYKPPQPDRIKKPSEPVREVYQPPIPVIDHPQSEIKGYDYREPAAQQQQQRIKSPSTSTGVKRPQPQLPRAPVVVSRPQPPSLPATSVKKTIPAENQIYEKPRPQPPAPQPGRIKQPSQPIQSVSRPSQQPRYPSPQPIDHPNANVKGGSGYPRPANPPSSPSTSYEQKTTSNQQRQPSGCRGDGSCGAGLQIVQPDYKPQRIKTAQASGIKTVGHRPGSASHQSVVAKQPNPEYEGGSSYTRGPEVYPKPEFGQNSAYQPISTPSRNSQGGKQGLPSQNTITQSQNKPAYQGSPASSGFGAQVRPDYPFRDVPGHQPPHQPQVFPHRDNPDHPNESLKGSGAYRPPPPAGFQGAASEVSEQQVAPEPEPEPAASSLLGDIGAE